MTIDACRSSSGKSGTLSPLMHHLDFLVGGTFDWAAGFHRRTIRDGNMACSPASCSCHFTSSSSFLLRAFTAPVASNFDPFCPSATFHFSHSSAPWISFYYTSSEPFLTIRLASAGFLLRENSVKPIYHLIAPASL